jgi:hypothetical protein
MKKKKETIYIISIIATALVSLTMSVPRVIRTYDSLSTAGVRSDCFALDDYETFYVMMNIPPKTFTMSVKSDDQFDYPMGVPGSQATLALRL